MVAPLRIHRQTWTWQPEAFRHGGISGVVVGAGADLCLFCLPEQ